MMSSSLHTRLLTQPSSIKNFFDVPPAAVVWEGRATAVRPMEIGWPSTPTISRLAHLQTRYPSQEISCCAAIAYRDPDTEPAWFWAASLNVDPSFCDRCRAPPPFPPPSMQTNKKE